MAFYEACDRMKVDFDAALRTSPIPTSPERGGRRIAPEGSGAVRRIPFGKSEANPYRPPLASPGGVAERSESFKIMIASGNHTLIQ